MSYGNYILNNSQEQPVNIYMKQNAYTQNILDRVAEINPYNRQGENSKGQYYIYNMGFLASYLAALMEQDPFIYKRFVQHCEHTKTKKIP